MKTTINGIYKKNIFQSEKGFIIGLFKIKDTDNEELDNYVNKTITFTGNFHELILDEAYKFEGEIVNHPKYGLQFQVDNYERLKPIDKAGIIEFLSSDLFPGVGAKMATSIIDTLGNDALNIIMNDPNKLMEVPKLSNKKATSIIENLKKYEESNTIYIYLNEIGFNIKEAMSIYNRYKKMTMDVINNNIYQIINSEDDISFLKVDQVALKQGIDIQDKNRIKACIIYIMEILTFQTGDTYIEYIDIIKNVEKYLKIELNSTYFIDYLYELENENMIVKYDEHYYLKDLFKAEDYVCNRIIELSTKNTSKIKNIDNSILELEKINNIKYNDKQKLAIKKAIENNILIITGGPGTGKTTIIKAIVELYSKINDLNNTKLIEKLALLAPTGRASKRMSEATYLPASTIHRFLKWDKETNKFAINEFNPNMQELIIVDEVSMIDINLLSSLFKGLTNNIKIVLVGDYNQLPSVGPGQVLKDLIDSEIIDTIELDLLYRQDENSYIPTLAKEINENNLSENFYDKRSDYNFLVCNSNQIINSLKQICNKLLEKGYDYKNVQIMAPMYHGENGIDNLNRELQHVFNPQNDKLRELEYGDVIYRENDKVLQLVNFPDLNVFNGDIGIIKEISYANENEEKKDLITIDFDGSVVTYTPKDFNKFKHGYIISIHKSQGSEFDVVILPITNSYKRMLYRKLIYTAVTRAKKKLIVIGELDSFVYSVNNHNEYTRKTSLLNKINKKLYNK